MKPSKNLQQSIMMRLFRIIKCPIKTDWNFSKNSGNKKNEIPFILFTGKGREDVVIQALNLGADHYVNKQGSPDVVYGELSHVICSAVEKNRTKLKSANEALALYKIREAVVMSDADFAITAWNKAAEELFGWQNQEVLGQKIDFIFKNIQVTPSFVEVICSVREKGRFKGEIIFQNKMGQKRNGILEVVSIILENGKFTGTVAVCSDITERKKTENTLRESEEKFRNLSEESPNMIFINKKGRVVYTNKKCEELTGYTKEEFYSPNFNFLSLIAPENIETLKSNFAKHLKSEEVSPYEYKLVNRNGERIDVIITSKLIKYEEETAILGIVTDISERKKAENELQGERERFDLLFEHAPLGILVIDPESLRPVEFNQVAHEQLGYTRAEFAKLCAYDYKAEPPNETNFIVEKILRDGKAQWETKHRTKNGDIRDVVILSRVIELYGKKLIHSIYRDVTEERRIELALMDSEAKYRQLVEMAHEGIWAINADNCTVYVNNRVLEMLGYSENEILGKNMVNFLDNSDADLVSQKLDGFKQGHQDQCEFIFVRKDGSPIYTNVAVSPIQDDGGNRSGTLVLISDITERKKTEEKLKENSERIAMMNEKLRVMGGLTRHDVRNKLFIVTGNTFLLKKKYADQADIVEGLSKIEQAIKDSVKIFDFAKNYEQLGAEKLRLIAVEKTIDEAEKLFSGSLTIKVKNECHGLNLLADSFLRQLFYNFMDNTRKYAKTATEIRIYFENADDNELRLIYEDNGLGISMENKQYLFKEGFSTGNSTGFGLFLIKKMTENYGWKIQETGEPGKGARFIITIPNKFKKGEANYTIIT
jgi:PAS domain S-box-containing protein